MSHDFIDDLILSVNRVISPDAALLKEILILSGMPRKTENLRYLSFNRRVMTESARILQFSAVAVINNRWAGNWQLKGYKKKLSRIVFNKRWTRNPLDLFLNNLRCDPEMIRILGSSTRDYTVLGILQVEQALGTGILGRRLNRIRPVIGISGIDAESLQKVIAFEIRNEIRKMALRGLPISPAS